MCLVTRINYAEFVYAALQNFAASANQLFATSNVMVQVIKTDTYIMMRVNGKPVCRIKVEPFGA
jgi:hypothetical protein